MCNDFELWQTLLTINYFIFNNHNVEQVSKGYFLMFKFT